jgi:hypothetical protein
MPVKAPLGFALAGADEGVRLCTSYNLCNLGVGSPV